MKTFLSRFAVQIGLFIGLGLGYDKEDKVVIIALPFCGINIYIGKIKKPSKLSTNAKIKN